MSIWFIRNSVLNKERVTIFELERDGAGESDLEIEFLDVKLYFQSVSLGKVIIHQPRFLKQKILSSFPLNKNYSSICLFSFHFINYHNHQFILIDFSNF